MWEGHRRQSQLLRRTPKEFSIEAASGLLNCDRRKNSSFSTSGNGRELFCEGRYDWPGCGRGDRSMDYFAGLDISMDVRRMFAFSIAKAWWFARARPSRRRRRSPANWRKRQLVVA